MAPKTDPNMGPKHPSVNAMQHPGVFLQHALQNPLEVKPTNQPQNPRYQPKLPQDIGPFKRLVQEYTRIPADQLDAHIHKIRDMAYAIAPHPGFGLWEFTRISVIETDPAYQLALVRLREPNYHEFIIDVGCGLGQNIRQLIHAGVSPLKIGALELRRDLFEVGLELFRDRFMNPPPDLVTADLIRGDTVRFNKRATILHVANFFHLFDWRNQVTIAYTLHMFLQAQVKGEVEGRVYIFGRQVGSLSPSERDAGQQGSEERYLHDQASFQQLWDHIYWMTGWRWKVQVEMLGKMPPGYDYLGEDARYQRFLVWRVPR